MMTTLVRGAHFNVSANAGLVFLTTKCCNADATGVSRTAANPGGVACRGCYRPISVVLGWAGLANSDTAERELAEILRSWFFLAPDLTAERVFTEARALAPKTEEVAS